MTIELDGRRMTDRSAAHDYLKERLDLPDHYGRNLDALYDLLSEFGAPTVITVPHADTIKTNLGAYGDALLKTLRDAADKNLNISIVL